MIKNKFKIVIPSYNNEEWVEYNIASILNQTYNNYEVLYIDDASTDNTFQKVLELTEGCPNWTVVRNETNMRRGYNLNPYNPHIQEFMEDGEEIILFVDGDDWLYDEYVLEKLNQSYNQYNYWMTYGKFVCYPGGEVGNPQNTPYPDVVHQYNAYRQDIWRASHLRSFKWHLYRRIKKEDLIFTQTGEYYFHAEDLAVSFPCLEMCPKDKIGVIDYFTYVYNVSPQARARVEDDLTREPNGYRHEVAVREHEVRNRPPYSVVDTTPTIVANLGGGLGNMMFMIAAAYRASKQKGHRLMFSPNHYGILHGSPISYRNTVFSRIPLLDKSLEGFTRVIEGGFHHMPLDIPNVDVILDGYYQSYKYFKDVANEVRSLFAPTSEIVSYILDKYTGISNGTVAIHVRRGNYVDLSLHHYNLPPEYYLNAMNYFKGYRFMIFSDDIEWCKEKFKGGNITFVGGENEVIDLYMMSMCEHNVIANSTFGWWGAWLNNNPNKKVIYPDKWFGPAYAGWKTNDLFPDEWICLAGEVPQITINVFDGAFGHLVKPNGRYSSVHDKICRKVEFVEGKMEHDGITLFTEGYAGSPLVQEVKSKYKIGWFLESKALDGGKYAQAPNYLEHLDLLLTHDEELIKNYPDKVKFAPFGGTWIKTKNYGVHNKTKNISMIYSSKTYMPGHALRHEVAKELQGVDLYGHGTPRPIQYKEEALMDYRYSIVIENAKTNNYFTEKLVDCFAVGTIPIYWGCPNIGDFFDIEGMVIVNSKEEILEAVGKLDEKYYNNKIEHIKNNLKEFTKYETTEDWMYENIFKNLK